MIKVLLIGVILYKVSQKTLNELPNEISIEKLNNNNLLNEVSKEEHKKISNLLDIIDEKLTNNSDKYNNDKISSYNRFKLYLLNTLLSSKIKHIVYSIYTLNEMLNYKDFPNILELEENNKIDIDDKIEFGKKIQKIRIQAKKEVNEFCEMEENK